MLKNIYIFFRPEESSTYKQLWIIKQTQNDKIDYSTNYTNFCSFYRKTESHSEKLSFHWNYNKAKRLFDIEEVNIDNLCLLKKIF